MSDNFLLHKIFCQRLNSWGCAYCLNNYRKIATIHSQSLIKRMLWWSRLHTVSTVHRIAARELRKKCYPIFGPSCNFFYLALHEMLELWSRQPACCCCSWWSHWGCTSSPSWCTPIENSQKCRHSHKPLGNAPPLWHSPKLLWFLLSKWWQAHRTWWVWSQGLQTLPFLCK